MFLSKYFIYIHDNNQLFAFCITLLLVVSENPSLFLHFFRYILDHVNDKNELKIQK